MCTVQTTLEVKALNKKICQNKKQRFRTEYDLKY